jgi:hypothetical protein
MKISEIAKTKQRHGKQLYHLIYTLFIVNVRVNYRELGFLARNNPRGVTRRKHPEGRRPEGCFLRATLPRDVFR